MLAVILIFALGFVTGILSLAVVLHFWGET
jgi:hypothetical protein